MGTHARCALIPMEYDNRLLRLSQLLDVVDDAPDLLVHKRHRGVVCAALSLEEKEDAKGAAALTPVAEEARVVGIERVERRDPFGSLKGLPLRRRAVRRKVRPVWAEPVRPLENLIIQTDIRRASWWQGRGRQLDLLI